MRSCAVYCILVACLAATPVLANPGQSANAANPENAGEIHGVIEACSPEGPTGFLVYVPGESPVVKLGGSGGFTIRQVTPGTHSLAVEDKDGRVLLTVPAVAVEKKRVTDLGPISACPDLDDDGWSQAQDCDDLDASVYPGASEACDGVDNNCDGTTDEGCQSCTDADSDGHFAQAGCGTGVDCDDDDAAIHPGAQEICDGLDNDCDSLVDHGFDADADGYTSCGGDCDDGDGAVHPGAVELCDDLDNDCDGETDEDADCSCSSGLYDCGGLCVDLMSDPQNCGACGAACDLGEFCDNGVCVIW